jgi:hypothetical protein
LIRFEAGPTLEAVAVDCVNLARFEATRAARDIRDFLQQLAADIDLVEATAHDFAAFDGPHWLRPYPRSDIGTVLRGRSRFRTE